MHAQKPQQPCTYIWTTIAHQCSDIIAPSRACRLDQRHRMLAARVGRPTVGQHRLGTAGQLLRVAATTSATAYRPAGQAGKGGLYSQKGLRKG